MKSDSRSRQRLQHQRTRSGHAARAWVLLLALGIPFIGVPEASADMDRILRSRTLLHQAFTLCVLGLPRSLNAAECIQVFERCGSLPRRVRRRVCRPRFDSGTHARAQAAVDQVLLDASAFRPRTGRTSRR